MPVTKNVQVGLTVLRTQLIGDNSMSVYFERPIGFQFEAGDWIDINFADTNLNGGKVYSLSSSPTESDLAISFRIGITPFKRQLQSVKPGDKLYISQYGNDYGFQLNDKRSSVLIAGGIGVAPFRSMVKELYDKKVRADVQLIYLNKTDDFLFKTELDIWRQHLPQLSIDYIATKDLKRKAREQQFNKLLTKGANRYYIAGAEAMVDATEHLLINRGVAVRDIRIDSFGTY